MSRDIPEESFAPEKISGRLRQQRRSHGLSQRQLAEEIGMMPHQVGDAERGKTIPSAELIARVCQRFSVNPAALLYGGEGFPRTTTIAAEAEPGYGLPDEDQALVDRLRTHLAGRSKEATIFIAARPEKVEQHEGKDAYRAIPYYSSPVAAGQGRVVEEDIQGYVVVHDRLVKATGQLVAVQVEGQSMEPTLTSGSIVAIDVDRNDPRSLDGKIVCSRTDNPDEVVVKRLEVSGRKLFLCSDNPDRKTYGPIEIDIQQVEQPIIGQVVWAWVDLL